MDKETIKRLRCRWNENQLADLNKQLGRFAFTKYVPYQKVETTDIQSHEVDGRSYYDLRGATISTMVNWLELDGFDFSGGQFTLAGQFGPYAKFSNCLFTEGRFNTNIRKDFESCDFSGAMMVGAVFGERFCNCTFRYTDLRRAMASSSKFNSCRFEGTNFNGADFSFCKFEHCVFESCRFLKTSFFKSDLESSSFHNCSAPE